MQVSASIEVDPADLPAVLAQVGRNGPGRVLSLSLKGRNHWAIRTPARSNPWLFSVAGDLRWRPESRRLQVLLKLDANPTRFLAHQSTSDLATIRALAPVDALRLCPVRSSELAAQTLDGGDNVLVGLDRLGGTAFDRREERWQELLAIYLDHLRAMIGAALSPPGLGAQLVRMEFALTQAEVYWELHHRDAISFTADLSKSLLAADGTARVFGKPVMMASHRNTRWTRLPLTKDIAMKTYAKTIDRVRCEISFDARTNQEVRRLRRPSQDVLEVLSSLRHAASRRMQLAWSAMMTDCPLTDETTDLIDFVEHLARAVPEERRRCLLTILVNHRGITETDSASHVPRSICLALEREGIVGRARARRGAGRRYALTLRYSRMVDRLLERHDAPGPLLN
ncbi:hypothetical protein [Teichococcus vastitatis]|uniref:Uncharacterized protein n=1 Tax=Teichococcus vastitatis TaxID=2307076 RepID=A0ABS9W920_9PROT|nr:hypothetical protein [Pseudoroseomonas vastitatis]MCI0755732.1 hypothetical protein [Pseudoroseomonas vastitatis]